MRQEWMWVFQFVRVDAAECWVFEENSDLFLLLKNLIN